jgi:hypothetical protein
MTGPNAFAAEFDADMHDAFLDAGLADLATYTAPAGEPVERRVIVDTGVQVAGEYGQVIGSQTVIAFLLADGPVVADATVVVGARTYTTDRIAPDDGDDGSLQRWSVRNG